MSSPNPAPRTQPEESRNLQLAWYAALILAALLRIVLIDAHGLWNNEFITLRVLKLPYAEIVPERLSVNHMPLYFLMEKAWVEFFGDSEASLRAIGAIFGWLAVWAVGRLARRLGGLRLGVPVIFAAALNQLWLESSLDARMYSILIWAAAEATDAWFAWTRSASADSGGKSRGALIRWTLVSVFALHVHMLYAVVLALHLMDALIRRWRNRLPLRPFAIALAVGTALCIPISIAWVINQDKFGGESELTFKTPGVLVRTTVRELLGEYSIWDSGAIEIVAVLLFFIALVGMIGVLRRPVADPGGAVLTDRAGKRDFQSIAWGYLLFLLGLWGAQVFSDSQIIGSERYYAVLFPGALILGVAGWMHWVLRHPRFGIPLAVLVLAAQTTFTAVYYLGPGEGFREGIGIMEKDLPPGRGIVTVFSGGGHSGFNNYYGQSLSCEVLFIDRYEESRSVVSGKLLEYARTYPEFWVMTYHEKEETIWKVLNSPKYGFEALSEIQELGKSKVGLFRHVGVADPTPDPADDGSAPSLAAL